MDYSVALEQQIRVMRWIVSPPALAFLTNGEAAGLTHTFGFQDGETHSVRESRNVFYTTVADAEPYYLSAPLTQVMAAAATSLPESWALTRERLPTRSGFVWIEGTWPFPSSHMSEHPDASIALRALSWALNPAGDTVSLASWCSLEGVDARGMAALAEQIGRTPVLPASYLGWPIGQSIEDSTSEADAPARATKRALAALFAFLEQRITVAPRTMAGRAARRRVASEWQHEPIIRVVQLRRKSSETHEHGDRDIAWSCQWIVSGHWRQQWYPSLERHQPIWVMPYVKGPDSKPLKQPPARVFAVVR